MADTVERLAVLIEANTRQYTAAMMKLQRDTNVALRGATSSVKGLDAQIALLSANATKLLGGLGIGFGLGQVAIAIRKVVAEGANLVDTAQKIGLTTDALQRLHFAATQGGMSIEEMDAALAKFSTNVGQASRGQGDLYKILKLNNIAIRDSAGNMRPLNAILNDYADLVSRAQSAQEKNVLTTTAFGRSAQEMGNVFENGSAGIKAAGDQLQRMGGIMDDISLKHLARLDDKFDEWTTWLTSSFKRDIAEAIIELDNMRLAIDEFVHNPSLESLQRIWAAMGSSQAFEASQGPAFGLAGKFGAGATTALEAKAAQRAATASLAEGLNAGETTGAGAGGGMFGAAGKFSGEVKLPPSDEVAALNKRYKDLVASLNAEISAVGMSERGQAILNAQMSLGSEATEAMKNRIGELAGQLYDAKKAQSELNDALQFGAQLASDALSALIPKIQTGNDALDNLLNTLIQAVEQAVLLGNGPLAGLFGTSPTTSGGVGGLFGDLIGAFTGRAGGGNVSAGMPYIVGEHKPELFIPNTAGRIAANSNAPGGGPLRVVVNNNAPVNVSAQQSKGPDGMRQLEIMIDERIDQRVTNGSLDAAFGSRFGARVSPRRLGS